MNKEYAEFAARFAASIVGADFAAAHGFFAPWLRAEVSADELRAEIETRLREMNEIWEIDELIFPAEFRVDGNSSTLASLKENHGWRAPRRISPKVTDENFRQWMSIEFLPDERDERVELDGWFDFWFILVETEGNLRIGFYELEDVD